MSLSLYNVYIFVSHSALDAYLDFLDSSNTTTDKVSLAHPHLSFSYSLVCAHTYTHSQEAQPTPCIDNILRNYQQRNLAGHKINEPAVAVENGGYEGRLFLLEKQLTDLLQRSKVSHSYSMIYFLLHAD